MIVVLPFENLGAPEDEYFANGTTDAITARLASVSGLGVISRQSAIQYKKTTKSIKQIGEELGVDYILEGTVQRERPGDPTSRVRVIPQLIRVADDTHVWADTYDETMTEVFRVQSDIAERVAAQLDVALLEPERRAIEKRPTENLAAYEAYLRGWDYYWTTGGVADAELSVQFFQKAVSTDPQFAEAWAGLASAYHELYWSYDRPEALAQETEAAKRAQELAPDLPETHLALGSVAYAQRDFDKALEHFERAQRLQPSGDGGAFHQLHSETHGKMAGCVEVTTRMHVGCTRAPPHCSGTISGIRIRVCAASMRPSRTTTRRSHWHLSHLSDTSGKHSCCC